ncbi:putative T-complex protein 11 [Lyophyllum shimeji]|uniref:T-complex protein 11 n=1 Tax=Lyophyllum shimeji TaxID=47721 RepID=A0A9P3ULC3_LYOSH|nr:putative T-complex protein 11 [Lyophyllum shimeji]
MSSLPSELLHALDQAYFMHILATDPAKVIPPGKSLISMMAHAPAAPDTSSLHARVEKVVHKAFWDEALQSLSSPSPAVQLPRLKLLYSDLHDALSPLFPPKHPILLTLAAPLPPTSSPLHSALALLREILGALRERCAPVRDLEVDALLVDLASPPAPGPSPDTSGENPLAVLLVSTMRKMIGLADTLKRDLTNTVLGTMSEAQLMEVIRQQADARERELILNEAMWGGDDGSSGIEVLTKAWSAWTGLDTDGARWIRRLLQALTSPHPVTCQPADPNPNALPPQFFFSRPLLLYIQNYLQALVVAASLKSLVRLPPAPAPPVGVAATSSSPDFIPRIWTLLKAEIDREEYSIRGASTGSPQADGLDAQETKLINLADEVIRARRLFGSVASMSEDEERDLRAVVERTLRLADPVFVLLQGRLKRALELRLEEAVKGRVEGEHAAKDSKLPMKMKSGRTAPGNVRPLVNGPGTGGHDCLGRYPIEVFMTGAAMRAMDCCPSA